MVLNVQMILVKLLKVLSMILKLMLISAGQKKKFLNMLIAMSGHILPLLRLTIINFLEMI